MRTYHAQGIVIKRIKVGEADKIVTIFTKKYGKIPVIAKGVRKIHSKKAPHLELFNHIKFFMHQGRTLDIITEIYTLDSFPNLRFNLKRIAYAYKILEVIDRLCAEKQTNIEIYFLLLEFLKKFNNLVNIDEADEVNNFNLQVLWYLGFVPKGSVLNPTQLENMLEQIMEKHIYSNNLIIKL